MAAPRRPFGWFQRLANFLWGVDPPVPHPSSAAAVDTNEQLDDVSFTNEDSENFYDAAADRGCIATGTGLFATGGDSDDDQHENNSSTANVRDDAIDADPSPSPPVSDGEVPIPARSVTFVTFDGACQERQDAVTTSTPRDAKRSNDGPSNDDSVRQKRKGNDGAPLIDDTPDEQANFECELGIPAAVSQSFDEEGDDVGSDGASLIGAKTDEQANFENGQDIPTPVSESFDDEEGGKVGVGQITGNSSQYSSIGNDNASTAVHHHPPIQIDTSQYQWVEIPNQWVYINYQQLPVYKQWVYMNLSIPVNQYQWAMMGNNQWMWMCAPVPLSLPLPEPTAIASNPQLGTWVSEPLSLWVLRATGPQVWEERLAELKAFKEEHGHANVPNRYPTNPQLGRWVMTQRTQYRLWKEGKQSSMTNEKIRELEAIGFVWVLRATGPQVWEERLAELKAFKEEHGHANVPTRYPTNPLLGRWVDTQRTQYRLMKEGKQSPMRDERIRELEAIGFVWVLRATGPQVQMWEERLAELKAFKEEHGHANVPRRYPTNPQLGRWVDTQRTQYRLMKEGKHSRMTKGMIRELEEVGFVWDVRANNWNIHYQKLIKYKEVHGTTKVLARHDLKLYRWASTQREKYALLNEERKSLLEPDKAKLLHEIGFDFYRRECSKKVHRIEWKFMHELVTVLEEFGYTWFSLDRAYEGLTYRPDGVVQANNIDTSWLDGILNVVVESSVIFVEVDEKGHDPLHPSYTPLKEQTRMKALKDAAMKNGKVSVVFIRVNTGRLSEVLPQQVETVREVLANIHSSKPKGYHVNYVDYRDDHVHVLESEKKESGVDSVTKFHTENFDEKVTRLRASDLR